MSAREEQYLAAWRESLGFGGHKKAADAMKSDCAERDNEIRRLHQTMSVREVAVHCGISERIVARVLGMRWSRL